MSDQPTTGVMTRSMISKQSSLGIVLNEQESNAANATNPQDQEQLVRYRILQSNIKSEHKSNVTNTPTSNILLSPITQHSPEISPSDISTRLEDTLERNTTTPNNKDTSSFFISQLQLIGSDTEDRIRNSQNSIQQQITNLSHKHDQLALNNSNLFERMSLQINHTSVILENILIRMNTTNTIHPDSSPLKISNASINASSSSSTSSTSSHTIPLSMTSVTHNIPLSVKEINTILGNSVPIKSTPDILKSYNPLLENNTPANFLHSHEETCELYGLGTHTYVQLFLTNVKRNSLEIYETFIQKTSLTRMNGRSKLDNPFQTFIHIYI